MKILYSLPHPSDRLTEQRAGHMVRASALLENLQKQGHTIFRSEAAENSGTKTTVGFYRKFVRKILPAPIAMRIRDIARIRHGKNYAEKLVMIAREQKPDLILETHIAFSLAGKIASEVTGIPLVLDDCSPAHEEEQQYGVGLRHEAQKIHHIVTNQAGLIVAVNQTIRDLLASDGVDPGKLLIVKNGIDDSVFHSSVDGSDLRKKHQIPSNAIVIVFVGSFQPYHKVNLLLDAFDQIRNEFNVRLLLIGDGRTKQQCVAQAQSLGIESQVTFTGRVPYSNVPNYIAAGDIAVMPATNNYGNPMKVYEYMALRKVVVAPDQPTIREIVTHGQDCYLFVPEDSSSLADALKVLVSDHNLRDNLSAAAADEAVKHSWRQRAKVLEAALSKLIQNGSPLDV